MEITSRKGCRAERRAAPGLAAKDTPTRSPAVLELRRASGAPKKAAPDEGYRTLRVGCTRRGATPIAFWPTPAELQRSRLRSTGGR